VGAGFGYILLLMSSVENAMSQSSSSSLRIRTMTGTDVAIALAWAEAQGWNPGWHDAECFYAADPNGFFIGEVGGAPVACLSAVAYDNAFGFIGLYIVKPEWRGKGLGMQLWKHGLGYLANRNIGLDGVVAQQGNYRRSGFQLAYRNIRYGGVGQARPHSERVVRASDVPFEQLAAYDRRYFPAERHAFLRRWIAQPDSLALVALAAGEIRGFGVVRACCVGHKIYLRTTRKSRRTCLTRSAQRWRASRFLSMCRRSTRQRFSSPSGTACRASLKPRGCTHRHRLGSNCEVCSA
jgi:GNAT superfamily N-acetyltransferase